MILKCVRSRRKERKKASYRYSNEIIQIGAVLLNEHLKVIDEFNSYVAPQFGYLTSFITNLTGITEQDLSNAPMFAEALKDFLAWFPRDAKMVTWSNSDELQMRNEAISKGITDDRLFEILDEVIDSQKMFGDLIGIDRMYKLEEALIISDVCLDGRLHDGLVDARNTAALFIKMKTETTFRFNEYYESARKDKTEHLGSSLGRILAGLNLAGCHA